MGGGSVCNKGVLVKKGCQGNILQGQKKKIMLWVKVFELGKWGREFP